MTWTTTREQVGFLQRLKVVRFCGFSPSSSAPTFARSPNSPHGKKRLGGFSLRAISLIGHDEHAECLPALRGVRWERVTRQSALLDRALPVGGDKCGSSPSDLNAVESLTACLP